MLSSKQIPEKPELKSAKKRPKGTGLLAGKKRKE